MPQTRSAKTRLRRDERKTVVNLRRKRALKDILKKARETHAVDTVRQTISAIDKAVKNHLFHKNKAARLKSQLTKGLKETPAAKKVVKATKKAKTATKKRTTKTSKSSKR